METTINNIFIISSFVLVGLIGIDVIIQFMNFKYRSERQVKILNTISTIIPYIIGVVIGLMIASLFIKLLLVNKITNLDEFYKFVNKPKQLNQGK